MLPFFGLALALGYERAKRAWKQLFASGVRTDVMHQEMREEWEQEEENKQKAKLDEYLTEKEQDGLGGILQLAPWPRLSCEALEVLSGGHGGLGHEQRQVADHPGHEPLAVPLHRGRAGGKEKEINETEEEIIHLINSKQVSSNDDKWYNYSFSTSFIFIHYDAVHASFRKRARRWRPTCALWGRRGGSWC